MLLLEEAARAAMEWVEAATIWCEIRKLSCEVDAAAVLFWWFVCLFVFSVLAQFFF